MNINNENIKVIIILIVLSLIPLFALIYFLGGGIHAHFNAERLMREQNITTARIIEVVRERPYGRYTRGEGAIINLEYEVEGVVYQINRNVHVREENRVGEELEIYYDYRNPRNFILVDRDRDIPPFGRRNIVMPAMAIIMLFFLIRALIKVIK